jgi:hypothetical protein
MGIVRMGVPKEFVLELKNHFNIKYFLETGTYLGQTALWAADNFEMVVTIENSELLYDQAIAKHGSIANIKFIYGHTKDILGDLTKDIPESLIFWLDSHWCGGESYGKSDQCPIIDEIGIINQLDSKNFILIDDARLFLSPPPLPNDPEQWPSIDKVIQELGKGKYKRYIVIFEDVIIAVPEYARDIVSSWCQKENTIAWSSYSEKTTTGRNRQLIKKLWSLAGKSTSKIKSLVTGGM